MCTVLCIIETLPKKCVCLFEILHLYQTEPGNITFSLQQASRFFKREWTISVHDNYRVVSRRKAELIAKSLLSFVNRDWKKIVYFYQGFSFRSPVSSVALATNTPYIVFHSTKYVSIHVRFKRKTSNKIHLEKVNAKWTQKGNLDFEKQPIYVRDKTRGTKSPLCLHNWRFENSACCHFTRVADSFSLKKQLN